MTNRGMQMNLQARTNILAGILVGAMAFSFSASTIADADVKAKLHAGAKVNAGAAVKLAQKDNCHRCHHVSRKKEGPSYRSIAEKYRGDGEAADKLVKHITLGEDRVKLSDGHEELHKFDQVHSQDEIKNLISWILAQ